MATEAVRTARIGGYESERPDVLRLVPQSARNVLDVGCSTGALGAALKRRQPVHVVGVEIDPAYAETAASRLDRVVVAGAEEFVTARPPEAPFDCIIFADVLEHLTDPWTVLNTCAGWLSQGGTAVVSLPNALRYKSLWRMVRSRSFPRDDVGIFDRTHVRWFALRDARALLEGAGLEVSHVDFQTWERRPRKRALMLAATHTPLGDFVAAQHILVGRKPG
jgi:2-polyprenyl-3-methyl-5-hydroxy-6-metoxy-1,4-benzoquinol methylase